MVTLISTSIHAVVVTSAPQTLFIIPNIGVRLSVEDMSY